MLVSFEYLMIMSYCFKKTKQTIKLQYYEAKIFNIFHSKTLRCTFLFFNLRAKPFGFDKYTTLHLCVSDVL